MPNKAGDKNTTYSQTHTAFLLPSINISVHLRMAEVKLAPEDGYSITYSAGKCFKCYIHAKPKSDVWTTDKRLIICIV